MITVGKTFKRIFGAGILLDNKPFRSGFFSSGNDLFPIQISSAYCCSRRSKWNDSEIFQMEKGLTTGILINPFHEINQIAKKHNANKVYVFGSCARKEENTNSDVDFLAVFSPTATLFDQCGMKVALEDLLSCSVDVVSAGALKNDAFRKNVYHDMVELC